MKRILLVEDELSIIKLLSKKLSERYTVFTANDGKKGLELAEKEHPDLILSDINMPVMDGLAMLSELRKSEFGKTVKVVMLTNLEPSPAIIKEAAKDQPSFYIIKSNTSLTDLVKKVDGLLM